MTNDEGMVNFASSAFKRKPSNTYFKVKGGGPTIIKKNKTPIKKDTMSILCGGT